MPLGLRLGLLTALSAGIGMLPRCDTLEQCVLWADSLQAALAADAWLCSCGRCCLLDILVAILSAACLR